MKIGFIGLGNVGGKLASSLLRNKFDLTVRDLNQDIIKEFSNKGANVANSPKELAEKVDLIITCLPSPKVCAEVMEGKEGILEGNAIVFDGSEDYHDRLNDESLKMDENSILVIRGAGPVGWPGSAEVVNMQPSDKLIKQGITELPCIGDGRQSGTSGSPSILNASPESATGGGLAWLRTGDKIVIDLNKCTANMIVSEEELEKRKKDGIPPYPESQTPWQEIQRNFVGELSGGGVLENAVKFQKVKNSLPRDNH